MTFLQQVVSQLLDKDIPHAQLVFILPNQRAGIYLRDELIKQIAQTSFFPEIRTFDNFAEQISDIPKTSSLELLFDFYSIYKQETPDKKIDSFEEFSGWASIVLDDFNDIDANLINQKDIFTNLKSINTIHNWTWEAETEMTKNYLIFFQKLEKYYTAFYSFLKDNNKGYQGLILREANSQIAKHITETDKHYVFVGFNYLKKSESEIIQKLLTANKASIYWDISEEMMQTNHSAGYFIRKYKSEWRYFEKNKINWITSKNLDPSRISVTGIPRNVGMIKYAGELIKAQNTKQQALVLSNQNLLQVALNSLPKTLDSVNITMGVPVKEFPLSDLITQLFQLDIHKNKKGYYYQSLLKVLQHPILLENIAGIPDIIQLLNKMNKVYIRPEDLSDNIDNYTIDFAQIQNLLTTNTSNIDFLKKINNLLIFLKEKERTDIEILHKQHQINVQLTELLNQYSSYIKDLKGLNHLYSKLLFSENITYIGSPNEGLQIMGFLETQVIDFENLIITSVNEGVLPKGKQNKSFIPFDLRLHFDLLTYKDEDAITSYHFYRLLNNAKRVELLYNTEKGTFGTGEMSRYIIQLLWKYPEIKQQLVSAKLTSKKVEVAQIYKTPAVLTQLKILASEGFSPSSIGSYVYNPMEFYYSKILRIKEVDEIEETVAANTMGTVLHEALEDLYKPFRGQILRGDELKKVLPIIEKTTQKHFKKNYKNGNISKGKNKLIFEVVVSFIRRFIKHEILEINKGRVIRIIALEQKFKEKIKFSAFDFPITIRGTVDRIDEVDGVLRIVDYKSGMVIPSQLNLDYFDKIRDYKYSKGMQLMLYAYLYVSKKRFGYHQELQAGIISFKNLNKGFMPVKFASKDFSIDANRLENFILAVQDLFIDIFNIEIPFEAIERG